MESEKMITLSDSNDLFVNGLLHNHLANLSVIHTNDVYSLLRFIQRFTIQREDLSVTVLTGPYCLNA